MARSYRDLLVWQKAKSLAVSVYGATQTFPRFELYGLTAQIRRAAISVVSNIAEGQGRLTRGEFLHFLGQARGSLLEVDAQLSVAADLHYVGVEQRAHLDHEIYQVLGLLNRLIESLRERAPARPSLKPRNSETLKPQAITSAAPAAPALAASRPAAAPCPHT